MKWGHRLAREAHRRRKERAPLAAHLPGYDAFAEVGACDKLLRSL